MKLELKSHLSTSVLVALAVLGVAVAAPSEAAKTPVVINGAGATFPYPLYSKWFSEYRKVDPTAEINYQSIGSGGGIRQLLDKTVDFGASDAPMTDEQLAKSKTPVIHIPTVLGAVVVTYNLPGIDKPIKLSGDVVADIFTGRIQKWGDPKIAELNPGVDLPKNTPILVVHRSDGSGTTAVFADYLSKVSPEWKQKVGSGTSLKWPTGLGGKGNEGVTGLVKQTPGSVGYVELVYAKSNKLPFALIKNKSGTFTLASAESITSAADGALKNMPKDFRISITNAEGKSAYPISSFTYLLIYGKMPADKGDKITHFLNWALTDGQKMAEPLAYAPLPKQLVTQVKTRVKEIKTE